MGKNNVFIEPRENGTFAIMKPNAKRASAICDTQKEAIAEAKRMYPDVKPDIAHVGKAAGGRPDRFRKA